MSEETVFNSTRSIKKKRNPDRSPIPKKAKFSTLSPWELADRIGFLRIHNQPVIGKALRPGTYGAGALGVKIFTGGFNNVTSPVTTFTEPRKFKIGRAHV